MAIKSSLQKLSVTQIQALATQPVSFLKQYTKTNASQLSPAQQVAITTTRPLRRIAAAQLGGDLKAQACAAHQKSAKETFDILKAADFAMQGIEAGKVDNVPPFGDSGIGRS
jgi:hypothetical protein